MIEVKYKDNVQKMFDQVAKVLGSERVNAEVANAVAKQTRTHFRLLEATRPNRLGGKRTHFWGQYVKTIVPRATPKAAVVAIADPQSSGAGKSPLALHFYGGEVHPIKATFLAIPARAEYYGRRPREFNDLHFAVLPQGGPVLLQAHSSELHYTAKGKAKSKSATGGGVAYWLRRSAKIRADKTVLPTPELILQTAHEALQKTLQRLAKAGKISPAGGAA